MYIDSCSQERNHGDSFICEDGLLLTSTIIFNHTTYIGIQGYTHAKQWYFHATQAHTMVKLSYKKNKTFISKFNSIQKRFIGTRIYTHTYIYSHIAQFTPSCRLERTRPSQVLLGLYSQHLAGSGTQQNVLTIMDWRQSGD